MKSNVPALKHARKKRGVRRTVYILPPCKNRPALRKLLPCVRLTNGFEVTPAIGGKGHNSAGS